MLLYPEYFANSCVLSVRTVIIMNINNELYGENNRYNGNDINTELSIDSLVNEFVSNIHTHSEQVRLHCAFCLLDFAFDFLLRYHIRENHLDEISKYTLVNSLTFDTCLYCNEKFYVKNLLSKHVIIRKYSEHVGNYICSS